MSKYKYKIQKEEEEEDQGRKGEIPIESASDALLVDVEGVFGIALVFEEAMDLQANTITRQTTTASTTLMERSI